MSMKQVIVLHNPKAGNEDHFPSEIVKQVESEGYACLYYSLKESNAWKEQLDQVDFLVVAGGDGTVRKVVKDLVQRHVLDRRIPLTILPLGTANNLSKSMGIPAEEDNLHHIRKWKHARRQIFDLGVIEQGTELDFFIEGAGYGVFPQLMRQMAAVENAEWWDNRHTTENLRLALKELLYLVEHAEPTKFWLQTDTATYEGKFLLVEAMNIRSIGPNIELSAEAVVDDGYLDVVCVGEEQRDELMTYIRSLLEDNPLSIRWHSYRTKKLIVHGDCPYMHVDDEIILPSQDPVVFEAREQVLEFLVPWQ